MTRSLFLRNMLLLCSKRMRWKTVLWEAIQIGLIKIPQMQQGIRLLTMNLFRTRSQQRHQICLSIKRLINTILLSLKEQTLLLMILSMFLSILLQIFPKSFLKCKLMTSIRNQRKRTKRQKGAFKSCSAILETKKFSIRLSNCKTEKGKQI